MIFANYFRPPSLLLQFLKFMATRVTVRYKINCIILKREGEGEGREREGEGEREGKGEGGICWKLLLIVMSPDIHSA